MSVRFQLRAGQRGYSHLASVGPNASYVAGHPDGAITRHSGFNFHEYQAGIPGFGVMKVFGDEVFTPNGTGYNMHPHHNFIIMAFVLAGTLTHINTIGKIDELGRDDYYVFSAGSGGKHSELNIGDGALNVIYVWVLPAQLLAPPSYRRARFDRAAGGGRITCLVGDAPGALSIGQTFKVSRLVSDADRRYAYRPARTNGLYAFVVEGEAEIGDATLTRRDSIALEGEDEVNIAVRASGTDLLLVETKL
jgi:redox-sensitive bicupin YhaK (pirin superfamily)